ncbi:uncharacterized protein LOC133292351 [Gastrolobium bilobum]|uniref:uncharacterized protein LOC133292351 n=1 Tax=Gastrolobium bilobum TaxID=150636 RepID=UPI002AB26B65|nr:uncharacterized protein LOC133292351 [Gastrolobium bilobum]
MGCCFSNPKQDQHGLKNQQPQFRSHIPKSNATHEAYCRVPSPPPLEEEAVKEVLSETPISKPQVLILTAEINTQMPITQHRKGPINKALEEASEEHALISETCSMSESFSTTTTATVTEKREDEEATSKRSTREGTRNRNRNRSQSDASRKRSYTVDGYRIGGRQPRPKSPARMPEPSPEKKTPVGSRSVRRRESDQVHRDAGDGSGRRSRSPSCARTVGAGNGRSQLRPPGGEGRRFPPPAKGVEMENGGSEKVGEKNDDVPLEESLENPHVSLECFIFL